MPTLLRRPIHIVSTTARPSDCSPGTRGAASSRSATASPRASPSRVDGYHPLPFADRVAAELRRSRADLAYLNLGERNLRAGEVRARQLEPALAFRPDLALVVCGANDALRPGYESRADAVDHEMREIVSALTADGVLVVTMSVFVMGDYPRLPSWLGPAFGRRMTMLAARTRDIASAHGTVHVHLADHPAADEALTCDDGLHGNGRGQAIAAAEMIRALGAHLRTHMP